MLLKLLRNLQNLLKDKNMKKDNKKLYMKAL